MLDDLALFLPFRTKRIFFLYTHNNAHDRFGHGLNANTELSYWIQTALKRNFPHVKFLRFQGEKKWRIDQITPKDVVIGHIGETYRLASTKTKRLIPFYPWCGHEDRVTAGKTNCSNLKQELIDLEKAASIIFLTSEYNVEKYLKKPCNFWGDALKNKRVRWVHQPIDLKQFPRIKTSYCTNNFLYIGNDNHMKCLEASRRLVAQTGQKLTIYGMKGNKLNHLDSKAVIALKDQADFFIQPGMWEAQCVSILEAAARGFISVVSKETGYPYEHPYLLKYGDDAYNFEVLQKLLKTSKEERKELADALYQSLVSDPNHNDWSQLTNVLVEVVKAVL